MNILGIETSCDETAAAVVRNGTEILSNVVVSQIDIFAEYGGVIPEIAARSHLEVILPVVNKALRDANCTWDDIDAIGVTYAPGLLGSLLIGTLTARTLAILHHKPLYAIHHLKSHVYANWITSGISPASIASRAFRENNSNRDDSSLNNLKNVTNEKSLDKGSVALLNKATEPAFQIIALVVSGGHTQILYMPAHNQFKIIGTTQDDAVGECFDKVAKILGLPYPGGPAISKAAVDGNPDRYKLPQPKVPGLNFSFSGLKTAVLRAVQKELGLPISTPSYVLKEHLTKQQVADFAASFQKAAIDILCNKLTLALKEYPETQSVVVAGGVSANTALREALPEAYFPTRSLSGDNGAMVAAACFYEIQSGVKATDPYALDIYPRISI